MLAMDDNDPDEGMSLMNEVMADDDAADPLLESYQHYKKRKSLAVSSPPSLNGSSHT